MFETCVEDGVMSDDFLDIAAKTDSTVYVATTIGWVMLSSDEVEYRNSLDYKVVRG